MNYEIVIKVELNHDLSDWFEGVKMEKIIIEENCFSKISSEFMDQSSLIGCLRKINNLGIEIISVNQTKE